MDPPGGNVGPLLLFAHACPRREGFSPHSAKYCPARQAAMAILGCPQKKREEANATPQKQRRRPWPPGSLARRVACFAAHRCSLRRDRRLRSVRSRQSSREFGGCAFRRSNRRFCQPWLSPAPRQGAKLAERLEGLTAAAQESLEREDGLRKAIEELTATEVSSILTVEINSMNQVLCGAPRLYFFVVLPRFLADLLLVCSLLSC